MARSAPPSSSRAATAGVDAGAPADEGAAPPRIRFAAVPPGFVIGVLIAAGMLIAALVITTFAEHRIYAGRVLPGVQVDGVDSSGQREASIRDRVARLGAELARAPVRVRIDGHELTADPSLLDLTVDAR